MPENKNDIEKILLNYLDGTNTQDELKILKHWINQDKENSSDLKSYTDIYLATSSINSQQSYDTQKAWNDWKKKQNLQDKSIKNNSPIYLIALKLAAAVLLIALTGFFSYKYLNSNKEEKITFSEYNVPRGSRSHIYLPDGTSVWLNAQSTLKYNQRFGQSEREVFLEGEAYFEVVRKEDKPFLVKVNSAEVKVLGTTFNVKAYPEENFIETTVVHGKVQVSSPQIQNDGQNKITLTANQKVKILKDPNIEAEGQQSSFKNDSINKTERIEPINLNIVDFSKNIRAQVYTSWKDSQWIIERETLKELAIKIERRYNVKIEFKDYELEGYIFSGKLKDESLEQVLQAISAAAPIEYSINQKLIYFSRNVKFRK